jgi:hypothetical protein
MPNSNVIIWIVSPVKSFHLGELILAITFEIVRTSPRSLGKAKRAQMDTGLTRCDALDLADALQYLG